MALSGISRKTATDPASLSTGSIIPAGTGKRASSSGRENISSCEPMQETLCLFGETTSTTRSQRKRASNARCFATKARTYRPSLSDRLTKSLIALGLVKGTTPKLVRQTFGLSIRDFASLPLGGGDAEQLKAACSSLNASHEASL